MKAWTHTARGAPSQALKLDHGLPQPHPTDLKPREALIKVANAALFAPEAQLMSTIPHLNSNPWIPGQGFSGTIVAVGDDTLVQFDESLKPGDAVFGMINPKKYSRYNGPLVEYMVAPRECVAKKPNNVKLDEASTLAANGCTVIGFAETAGWIKIQDVGRAPSVENNASGKRILITGGSTGTGLFMLQFAKTLAGKEGSVVTTCSSRHEEAVRALGADEVIDYTKHPHLHQYLIEHYSSQPFDMIMDITGTDSLLWPKCPDYLKPDGYFAFAGAMSATHTGVPSSVIGTLTFVAKIIRQVINWQMAAILPVALGGVPRKSFFHSGTPTARNLEIVRQLVEEGKMRGVVDSVWCMDDAVKAYEYLGKGKIRGVVVVSVQA